MLNGYSVNGAYLPTWVVRAAVVAAAAAAVVTVAPQRILMATAYGDASVVITLTETQTVAARATGNAGVTSASVTPGITYSGAVDADAAATGFALVVRVIPATAGGDASATGSALPNAKLGEVLTSSASTVIVCDAHRIRPGASIQFVGATADPIASLVTRSTLAPTIESALATGRAEASIKLDGESYFRHDGYVLNAVARCTPTIDQDKMALIASFGSIDFGNSSGAGTAFVRHRAIASGTGTTTPQAVAATRTARATVTAPAVATATVDGTRVCLGAVSASAAATRVGITPAQRHAAASSSEAFLNAVQVSGVRQARGTALGQSTAYQTEIFFGRQHPAGGGGNALAYGIVGGTTVNGTASSSAFATGSAETATQHYADASGAGLTLAGLATTGNQSFATASGFGVAGAIVTGTFNPGARGFATATGTGATAEFQRAEASGSAVAQASATPADQFYADATGAARAVATVGAPVHNYSAQAVGSAVASFGGSQFGTQFYADATGAARAVADVVGTFNPGARGTAGASGSARPANQARGAVDAIAAATGTAAFAQQQYGHVSGTVSATGAATGLLIQRATATGVIAQSTAVFVNARAISDEPAPEERQMAVSGEDRGMLVPGEDRTMVVSA